MKYLTLNDGNQMPANGFGTFQIPNVAECAKIVTTAIDAGYRLIDTAEVYGNLAMVGRGIQNASVSRDQLFITSKLWISNYGYDESKRAIDNDLSTSGLDYFDLLLLHQPFGDYYGSWRAMEEARQAGKVKSIGVSNFPIHDVIDLAEFNHVMPVVNQIEINPWRQKDQEVKNLQNFDIQPEAWSPLAENYHHLLSNPVLEAIGQKYGKSVAQVILRWELQRGVISLAKSIHPDRIQENLAIYDFKLSCSDMKAITSLNQNYGSVERLCGNLSSDSFQDVMQYASYVSSLHSF